MTPNQTQPIDVLFDTSDLELPPPSEAPSVELEPGRPNWEPDDGDFN